MELHKVVGLDLSLTGTGVVVIDEKAEITSQKLLKSKRDGDKPTDEINRILKLVGEIAKEVPDDTALAVIEGPAFMVKNATALVQLGALNYMVREKLYSRGVPFVIVAPTSLKKFVSLKGNTAKDLMFLATYRRWGVEFSDDNLMDAYGLARIAAALVDKKEEERLLAPQKEVINLLRKQL